VPPFSPEVIDSSAEVRVSPGNSHIPKLPPVICVPLLETLKVSLTIKPKLTVQASVFPLMGPLL